MTVTLRAVPNKQLVSWEPEALDTLSTLRSACAEMDRIMRFPPTVAKATEAAEQAVRIATLALALRPDVTTTLVKLRAPT